MASNMDSSINRGSDLFFEFSCFPCQENDRNTEAEFYCEECSIFYCSKCVEHHNLLYEKHTILGKEYISQWPKCNVGDLEQCQKHRKEKLTGFCEDHSELICHTCHINNHQKCSDVVLITDKVEDLHQTAHFNQLSATVDTQHWQLMDKIVDFEENMKSLEKSYKTILEEIKALRKKINMSLNKLEENTKKELDTIRATARTSIQTDIENCTQYINQITSLKEDWLRRKDKSDAMSFIKYRQLHDQSLKVDAVLQGMETNNERKLKFNPDTTIQQTLSTLSRLGTILNTGASQNKPRESSAVSKPDPIIKIKSSKKYSVKTESDLSKIGCFLTGICETSAGELIITDRNKSKVKLLDPTYKVVAHCDLSGKPLSICSIDSSLVAVSVFETYIHFIRVTNGQLVQDKRLKLQHACWGISHYQDNLYITDGRALYHYTVDGRLVSKIYRARAHEWAVISCAVSPDGDRIYVINQHSAKLVTLSRDGTVISTLTDPALQSSRLQTVTSCLHVTDSGQVLVCLPMSDTILQVDRDGREILAEVVTKNDGVTRPTSVYYSKHTGSLIVGMLHNNDMIVFKAK